MEKFDTPKIKEALAYALGGFITGTILATGIFLEGNYSKNKRNFEETNRTNAINMYSPLSYLELIKEENRVRTISQKNLFNNSIIIRFDLNSNGKVEKMVEDSSLWGKSNYRVSFPNKDKKLDWKAIDKIAERYANYFEKEN